MVPPVVADAVKAQTRPGTFDLLVVVAVVILVDISRGSLVTVVVVVVSLVMMERVKGSSSVFVISSRLCVAVQSSCPCE